MAATSNRFLAVAHCSAVRPAGGVIADSNPELVNLYRSVASDVDGVLAQLRQYQNSEEVFYAVRAQD